MKNAIKAIGIVLGMALLSCNNYVYRNGVYADTGKWPAPMVLQGDTLFVYTKDSAIYPLKCVHYKDSMLVSDQGLVFMVKGDSLVLIKSRLTAAGMRLVKISDQRNLQPHEVWELYYKFNSTHIMR